MPITGVEGPRCRSCKRSEAACAWRYGSCCSACSHWLSFDNAGNDVKSESGGRRRLPVEHGTERGFQQHRVRHELPCEPCASAHSRHVVKSKTDVSPSSSLRLVVSRSGEYDDKRTVAS